MPRWLPESFIKKDGAPDVEFEGYQYFVFPMDHGEFSRTGRDRQPDAGDGGEGRGRAGALRRPPREGHRRVPPAGGRDPTPGVRGSRLRRACAPRPPPVADARPDPARRRRLRRRPRARRTRSRRSRCTATSSSSRATAWWSACTAARGRWRRRRRAGDRDRVDAAGRPGRRGQGGDRGARRRLRRARARRSSSTPPRPRSRSRAGSSRTRRTSSPSSRTRPRSPSRCRPTPVHVVVAPGELDQHMRMIAGRWTVEFLSELNFAVAFVSAAGVTLDQGLTTSRRPLADVVNAARASAGADRRPDRRDEVRARLPARHRRPPGARRDSHRRRAAAVRRRGIPGRGRPAGDRQPPGGKSMTRPVTLFTGQWADLPLSELAAKCARWGFDGLELACWGDHFDVAAAVRDPGYAAGRRELLERHGLGVWAIGNHLVGQAVCDRIDERHRAVARPPRCGATATRRACGSAPPSAMKDTARAAAQLGVDVVTGFTGSLDLAPPLLLPAERLRGRRGAATRSSPSAGGRSSTSSRPRACASRSRSTRPRSRTTSPRRARRSRRSATAPASGSTSTRRTSSTSSSTRPPSSSSSGRRSSTRTSRTPSGGSTGAARSSAATSTSASPAAAGTSSRPGTATSTSRR